MSGNKILIVDNDEDIRRLLEIRLSSWGYAVIQADNGRQALSMAQTERPDLIILDVAMPGIDGGWVLHKLKQDVQASKIPVIFLTGLLTKEEEAKFEHRIGNEFFIAKPYDPAELLKAIKRRLPDKSEELPVRQAPRPKTILIVEDNADISKLLEIRLRAQGYNTVGADNGLDGLNKAKTEKVDLIVLDLVLPKMSGEEVCREIRKDKHVAEIPILMLTAKNQEADRVVGKVIGANCYLSKPYEASNLIAEIKKLLK